MVRLLNFAALMAGLGVVSGAQSGEAGAPKKGQDAKGPLELRIVAKKTDYVLDLGGKTPQEFKKILEEASKVRKGAAEIPPAPEVNLVLEIKNLTDQEQTALVGGDYLLKLQLKGPGAKCLVYSATYTADIKRPMAVKLAAGQSHSIPLKRLEHGFRGYGERCYWTEPGEYTLTANYQTRGEVGKMMNLTSAPVKLQVKKK